MSKTDQHHHEEEIPMYPIDHRDDHKNKASKFSYVNYFKEYASRTTLHGMQYFVEEDRGLIERLWWLVTIVFGTISCSYLIWAAWNKWDQSPVIVSFADTSTPVWKIPFPAVTICSELKVKQSMVNVTDLNQRYPNLTDDELFKYEASSLACDRWLLKNGNNTASPEAVKLIYNVSQTSQDIFHKCYWRLEKGDCSVVFSRVITEEGICYTFNMLNSDEFWRSENLDSNFCDTQDFESSDNWNLENGYDPNVKVLEIYPYRTAGSGAEAGFTITLKTYTKDIDYRCKEYTDGFQVSLHTPAELPRAAQHFFRVPLETEVVAAINPFILTTSETLREYPPQKRMCYFNEERYLKYFKVYTQRNCEIECISNYTLFACDCVEFFMPHAPLTPICSAAKRLCSVTAQDELLTIGLGLEDDYKNKMDPIVYEKKAELAASCNCLPSCTSISYEVETSQNNYRWQKTSNNKDQDGWSRANLRLFYKDSQFIATTRHELTSRIDFLANCGGLMGLCLGFSLMSLMEMIYFFTLRAFVNWRNHNWK